METKARKIRIVKIKERKKKKEREKEKKKKTKKKENDRDKEDSRRMRDIDMEWRRKSSKIRKRSKEVGTRIFSLVNTHLWEETEWENTDKKFIELYNCD